DQARRWALTGGDDYELCFTLPPEKMPELALLIAEGRLQASVVGELVPGRGVTCALQGEPYELTQHGYQHFFHEYSHLTGRADQPQPLCCLRLRQSARSAGAGDLWYLGRYSDLLAHSGPLLATLPFLAGDHLRSGGALVRSQFPRARRPRPWRHRLGRDGGLLADHVFCSRGLAVDAGRIYPVPFLRHTEALAHRSGGPAGSRRIRDHD